MDAFGGYFDVVLIPHIPALHHGFDGCGVDLNQFATLRGDDGLLRSQSPRVVFLVPPVLNLRAVLDFAGA